MPAARIHDAMRRGAGRAAVAIGAWCDAYRAAGTGDPLAPGNRFLSLQAAFAPPGAGVRAPGFGSAEWWGIFDGAYTRAGDYILRPADGAVWFIASQEDMLPVLCVRTTRVIDVTRPPGAADVGINGYGGVTKALAEPILRRWPVSLLAAGGRATQGGVLPADVAAGSWQVLLPAVPGTILRNGDLMSDDLGRHGVIASAELSGLGWRLLVRQAAS